MSKWAEADIPNQRDKIIIVTGANSGLGYETARVLAAKEARVILACRDKGSAELAATRIKNETPTALLTIMRLDLADLNQIKRFAARFRESYAKLDILINNAGVMALPYRETSDGFEMQFGTNHLGHFALTGRLLNRLLETPGARVVTVSSNLHELGKIDFDNLNGRHYEKWGAYGQSKLANLLFAYELQRRLEGAGSETMSVAAHPGHTATNLQQTGPRMSGNRFQAWLMHLSNRFLAQSPEMGALPILHAATAEGVNGCDYIGPDGLLGMRGYPTKIHSSAESYDPELARRLWDASVEMTEVAYEPLAVKNPASVADQASST
jgi:hypothetical protein